MALVRIILKGSILSVGSYLIEAINKGDNPVVVIAEEDISCESWEPLRLQLNVKCEQFYIFIKMKNEGDKLWQQYDYFNYFLYTVILLVNIQIILIIAII